MGKDLQTLESRIAEKVGQHLVDLIPEEQWLELVAGQVDHFMSNKAPSIIQSELEILLRTAVASHMTTASSKDAWDQFTGEQASFAIKEMLEKSATVIFSSMLAPVMTGLIQELANRTRTTY